MKIVILLILGFIILGYTFYEPILYFIFLNQKLIFDYFSFLLNLLFTIFCLFQIVLTLESSIKLKFPLAQIILLPSVLIPTIILFLVSVSLFWVMLDPEFSLELVNFQFINTTIIVTIISFTLLLSGLILGKKYRLQKIINPGDISSNDRKLDFINPVKIKQYTVALICLSAFVFPMNFGFRFDVIFQGGRNVAIQSHFLQLLVPIASILSILFTMFASICYAKSGKLQNLIVPIIDMIPRLMYLSRGFYLPLVIFIICSSLMGRYFPGWIYLSGIPILLIISSAALMSRGVSSGGIYGIASGINNVQSDYLSSYREFFEVNSNIGILSQAVAFHDTSLNYLDGFINWLLTILPLPSFLNISWLRPPDVHKLLGLTGIGIPMPVVGEIYFWMGWLGLLMFFPLGWWMGRLEANIIAYTKVHGNAYWPHVLIWASLLYGFILSFHSATRASSRFVIYTICFIWLLEFIVSLMNRKNY